jgi:hypothetical protein
LLGEVGMRNLARASIVSAALFVGLFFGAQGCSSGGSSATNLGAVPGPGGDGTGTAAGSLTGAGAGSGTGVEIVGGPTAPTGSAGTGSEAIMGPTIDAPATGVAGATGTGATTTAPPPNRTAGSLTAGTWDDNLNFDFYEQYLATMDASQMPGLPHIDRAARLEITAVDGAGAPVAGARVTVSDAGGKLFESTTRGDGKLFFFPGTVDAQTGDALTIGATFAQGTGAADARVGDATAKVTITGAAAAPVATLDLALVVDTTGSMGDELEYLKVEMGDIVARVARDFPGVSQRWAAIFYRDKDDAYVVRAFDFTSDVATLEKELSQQSADGGGDIPEAPDQALARLATLSWRTSAAARMAFWVADAPHHAAASQMMVQDVLTAHGLGVRFYPIAASGTDDLLEYTMRTAAEVTGGRYLFLTNDSGIGNDHKEPTIPCYVVTTLDKAMLRMIDMELTGTDNQPAPADIVRTSGNPTDGRCTTGSGQIVTIL